MALSTVASQAAEERISVASNWTLDEELETEREAPHD